MGLSKPLRQVGRVHVEQDGRKLLYFGGCDYHRMASHPKVLEAVRRALKSAGLNVAASRKTTGNHPIYAELEEALAEFFQAPAALLTSNGYATNTLAAQALAHAAPRLLIDARAHASLKDATLHAGTPATPFAHRDPADLRRQAETAPGSGPLFAMTDGLFAHDGAIAPLPGHLAALPKGARLWIDDAHAAGILGPSGRGALEHFGIPRAAHLQTITLSKAFGVYGGAILCQKAFRDDIIARSGQFTGNTPLPPPLAAGALESVRLLLRDRADYLARLRQNIRHLHTLLGHPPAPSDPLTPIYSLIPATPRQAAQLKRRLLAAHIFPPHIRYPGGPQQGYFRFAISSHHTKAQVALLAEALMESHRQIRPA